MLRIKNLIGYWRLRGDGHDESGNSRHMTFSQNITWVESEGAKTPSFNGTSSAFYTAANTWGALGSGPYSVSFWINRPVVEDRTCMVFTRNDGLNGFRLHLFT